MEDVVTETPPPSRFFQEDLNNFATLSPPRPSPFLVLNANPHPNLLCPSFLVIAISSPSLTLLHGIPHKTLIETLILSDIPLSGNSLAPSPRNHSCIVYTVNRPIPSPPTVIVAVQYPIAIERSCPVTKSLLGEIRVEKFLILDLIQS